MREEARIGADDPEHRQHDSENSARAREDAWAGGAEPPCNSRLGDRLRSVVLPVDRRATPRRSLDAARLTPGVSEVSSRTMAYCITMVSPFAFFFGAMTA